MNATICWVLASAICVHAVVWAHLGDDEQLQTITKETFPPPIDIK